MSLRSISPVLVKRVKMPKILVTGGAGYLGSILVPKLLQSGYTVIVLDNFLYQQTSLLDCCFDPQLTVIRGDVRNKRLISDCLKQVDFIFPLACITGAPACAQDPEKAKSVNVEAIKMLLALRSKQQKIVFPTTNSGYGLGQEGIFCTEETPLNPISYYGKLKAEAEKVVLAAGGCITLRLATTFGLSPRMRLDLLVNDFVYRAVADKTLVLFQGHFKRNYIHVRDAAAAFIHCLTHFETMQDEAYNVGLSEANLSKKELCLEIKQQLPDFSFIESEIGEDPDKRNYIVSNEKFEKTGYKARISLPEGITELIKGYQVIRRNQFSNI